MRNLIIALGLSVPMILAAFTCIAAPGDEPRKPRRSVRNVIWFHPNRVRVINGLAVGPANFQSFRCDSTLTVNGLNLELPGFAIFPLPVKESYFTVNGIDLSPFRYAGTTNGLSLAISSSAYGARGCNLAVFNCIEGFTTGLQAGTMTTSGVLSGMQIGIFSGSRDAHGLLIGGYLCMADTVHGVSLGGINNTKTQRGLQLGLINYTKELHGVQLGVINVAKNCRRRVMPLILISGKKAEQRQVPAAL